MTYELINMSINIFNYLFNQLIFIIKIAIGELKIRIENNSTNLQQIIGFLNTMDYKSF